MDVAERARYLRSGRGNIHLYPWVILACAIALGICSARDPAAGVLAAGAIGSLFILHVTTKSLILAAVLGAGLLLVPGATTSLAYMLLIVLATAAATIPRRFVIAVLQGKPSTGMPVMLLGTAGLCSMLLGFAAWPVMVPTCLCAFYMGARISRHWAMADARLLAWGEEGLVAVTRDLLLGRVTSGMLHDMAQPLNVISMANGNMGYIVNQLDIGDEERRQLLDRIDRIAAHTQGTAAILSLFRWFGRDGSDDPAELTARSALERAISATKSNVRHHGVSVELHGNGLDYMLPMRHGALEIMAVAALLCSFASFIGPDGNKKRGRVVLHAELSPAHLVITASCMDTEEAPVRAKLMDQATFWLVQQVAREASGDFKTFHADDRPVRFMIRLGRDDT